MTIIPNFLYLALESMDMKQLQSKLIILLPFPKIYRYSIVSIVLFFMLNQAQASKLDSLSFYLQKHKLQLGVSASTNIAYRTLFSNYPGYNNELVMQIYDEAEKPKLGYSASINLVFLASKHLSIETGIGYFNMGYKHTPEIIFEDPIDPNRNPILPAQMGPNITKLVIRYYYHYLNIPIVVNYAWGKNKLSYSVSAGINPSFLIDQINTMRTKYDDGSRDRVRVVVTKDFNALNLFPSLGVGFCYKLTPTSNIRLEPTFQYGVLKTIDAPISEHLWSGGLRMGYYFGGR
ncbi:MAG: hypothetical protein CFE21_09480 [Bacteroidetes bacterium B1(2017)]|nr:MAG: hypothetical protein CFE21_09480 [Bacteroidetes bacterium B1(2017)]